MGHVFLSYSHTDANYVQRLTKHLQSEGFEIWVDERLDYGSKWPHEIQKQLDSCEAFMIVMTPRSFASDWVQSELNRANRKKIPIFPLLLEGDEPWLSVENLQYVDVRGGLMPPEKFYGRLAEVTPRRQGPAAPIVEVPSHSAPPPAGMRTGFGSQGFSLTPKIALGIGGGVIAVLVIGLILAQALKPGQPVSPPASVTPEVASLPISVPSATSTPQPSATVVETATRTPEPTLTSVPTPLSVVMLPISGGEFSMGSNQGSADEKPEHKVNLKAFLIDKYEVTNQEYAACVQAGKCQPPPDVASFTQSHYFDDPQFGNYPVIHVDWEMARNYCAWREARLPTEAEWEKAAHGKDQTIYPWGNTFECSRGNFDDETNFDAYVVEGGPNCDGFIEAAPVGSFPSGASSYGVEDLSGNVWEWVSDWYAENYYKNSPVDNPTGPAGGQFHGLRGGSWSLDPDAVRATNRFFFGDNNINPVFVGFRCAQDAP